MSNRSDIDLVKCARHPEASSITTCLCPKDWLGNRELWVAADRRAIAAEAEIARLREEVARLQRERDDACTEMHKAIAQRIVAVERRDAMLRVGGRAMTLRREMQAERDEARASLAAALTDLAEEHRQHENTKSALGRLHAELASAAAPRTVTREQVKEWANLITSFSIDGGFKTPAEIVEGIVRDLGLQVEDQGKETRDGNA